MKPQATDNSRWVIKTLTDIALIVAGISSFAGITLYSFMGWWGLV